MSTYPIFYGLMALIVSSSYFYVTFAQKHKGSSFMLDSQLFRVTSLTPKIPLVLSNFFPSVGIP